MNISPTRARISHMITWFFAGLTTLSFLLTTRPSLLSIDVPAGLYFSLTLIFAGLTITMIGVQAALIRHEEREAGTALFLGLLMFIAGFFFLIFGLG